MSHSIEKELPPDIIEATLPYLSTEDIRSLSLTNKYFHKLLDFEQSSTLWHELYHKSFGSTHSDTEPLYSQQNHEYMSCSEAIMRKRFPEHSWSTLYHLRSREASLYTWGSLKHARLGYTSISHGSLPANFINNAGMRLQFGVNAPIPVPWFTQESQKDGPHESDRSIASISGGGFSFQILTESGKLYMTGSTYSGGHKGPGPREGEHDYNPFQELIMHTERNLSLFNGRTPRRGGVLPINTTGLRPLERPHENIYASFGQAEEILDQKIPGNNHIRRLFTRGVLKIELEDSPILSVDTEALEEVRFSSVSSGRSHILALSTIGDVYSWDGPDVEQGVRIVFEGLPGKDTHPILKIGCGWNYNCVSVFNLGLVVWKSRQVTTANQDFANAHYKVIPNTGEVSGDGKIVDFACCANMSVFFTTSKGDQLFLYSDEKVSIVNLPLVGKVVKLVGCYTTLAIFTEHYCYTVSVENGKVVEQSLVKLELEDPDDKFISLSTGDYHTVALTSKGKIYTWGLESELCGCLGLGSRDDILGNSQINSRVENMRSLRVIRPSLVKVGHCDYTCVAITAGGWQTGALILR